MVTSVTSGCSQSSESCTAAEIAINDAGFWLRPGCVTHDDCIIADTTTSCVEGCPVPLLKKNLEQFNGQLLEISNSICSGSCRVIASCEAYDPVCISGTCSAIVQVYDGGR
jgi:hypothetical protein